MVSQQEIRQYLVNKNIQTLFVSMLEVLCIDQPQYVPSYLVQHLEKNYTIKRGAQVKKSVKQQKKKAEPKKKKEDKQEVFINGFSFGQTHQLGEGNSNTAHY
jgi:hypothetical protein